MGDCIFCLGSAAGRSRSGRSPAWSLYAELVRRVTRGAKPSYPPLVGSGVPHHRGEQRNSIAALSMVAATAPEHGKDHVEWDGPDRHLQGRTEPPVPGALSWDCGTPSRRTAGMAGRAFRRFVTTRAYAPCGTPSHWTERRALFQVTGWGDRRRIKARDGSCIDAVQEVWFAGDHSDVGGGHPEGNSGSPTRRSCGCLVKPHIKRCCCPRCDAY